MIALFATWQDRIAPVFDVATEITVVHSEGGQVIHRDRQPLPAGLPLDRVSLVAKTGASVLVCGAISRSMQVMIAGLGIDVIGFVTGEADTVIEGWLDGSLSSRAFAMPGCGPRRHRRGRTRRESAARPPSDARSRGGGSSLLAAHGWPQRQCVCMRCGYREVHRPGIPCSEMRCPRCGAVMTRERESNNL